MQNFFANQGGDGPEMNVPTSQRSVGDGSNIYTKRSVRTYHNDEEMSSLNKRGNSVIPVSVRDPYGEYSTHRGSSRGRIKRSIVSPLNPFEEARIL